MTTFTGVDVPQEMPWVTQAAHALAAMFGLRTVGGWRASDPFPDHPSGRALDLMINDIPNGAAVGQRMADYLAANATSLGVDTLIWNRRSWNVRRGTWVPYTGTNPHTDHVHALFGATAPTGTTPLSLGSAASSALGATFNLDAVMHQVEGTAVNLMAALFGVALLAVGVVLTVKPRKDQ